MTLEERQQKEKHLLSKMVNRKVYKSVIGLGVAECTFTAHIFWNIYDKKWHVDCRHKTNEPLNLWDLKRKSFNTRTAAVKYFDNAE